jgi:hypothetical protein
MTLEKFVEENLIFIFQKIGIDKPSNFDVILDFMVNDLSETSGYQIDGNFNSEDVNIAFRRFLEKENL